MRCLLRSCVLAVALPLVAQEAGRGPHTSAVATAPAARELTDLRYFEGEGAHANKHLLDLYLPASEPNTKPVLVMFVHGGAWRAGDRRLYGRLGRTFSGRGIACAAISYRLTPEVRHPGHVQDCARAMSWLVAHAEEHGYDAGRIFLFGHSAGAHLVALLATDPKYLAAHRLSREIVRGVIPVSGPFDVTPRLPVLVRAFGEDAEVRRDASPQSHVAAGAPPVLVLWADDDIEGLPQSGREFGKALDAANVPVESAEIADRSHATILSRFGTEGDRTTDLVFDFVARHSRLAQPAAAATTDGTAEGAEAR
jgi:acetyl esterase/lipase